MCGIMAILGRHGPVDTGLAVALDSLRHRGPDGAGAQVVSLAASRPAPDDRAWLGHRRLAILDLSPRGAQPMTSDDGRFVITFNGEIYNYAELRDELRGAGTRFRSDSDTEVLLALWARDGMACLSRLVGMYAFVVVDRIAGTATLVRDPFGIKPLHYAVTRDAVLIASEVPTLVRMGAPADVVATAVAFAFLRFGGGRDTGRTMLDGILALPPGHVATFDFATGALAPPQHVSPLRIDRRAIRFEDAVAECRDRFLASVRLHLRSDVPVGAALSGGMDSSAIVCAMRQLEPSLDLQTFSFISEDPRQSEERWVDLVHAQVGGRSHKIRPTAEDLARDLEMVVDRQGEPFASASIYAQFRVFQRARECGVPVTLDGQGADELLAGYWPYVATAAADRLRAGHPRAAWQTLWGAARGGAGTGQMSALFAQAMIGGTGRSLLRSVAGRGIVPTYMRRDWLSAHALDPVRIADAQIGRYRSLPEHLHDTLTASSLPVLLRYADRNSMAFSVESRVPFLIPSFAEFLLSLPDAHVVSPTGERKHVFREAMRGVLPEPIRQRRDKIGFYADDAAWLRRTRTHFADVWDDVRSLPEVDAAALDRFLAPLWAGDGRRAGMAWRLLVYALWRRRLAGWQRERVSPE